MKKKIITIAINKESLKIIDKASKLTNRSRSNFLEYSALLESQRIKEEQN